MGKVKEFLTSTMPTVTAEAATEMGTVSETCVSRGGAAKTETAMGGITETAEAVDTIAVITMARVIIGVRRVALGQTQWTHLEQGEQCKFIDLWYKSFVQELHSPHHPHVNSRSTYRRRA